MFGNRENVAERIQEAWPPPCVGVGRFRRLCDLQTGSIWRDITAPLASAHGLVLDVGCGAQPYRGLLPRNVQYCAIDSAEAHEHFGYTAPDTIYYSGSRWPVQDGIADLVLSTETLEHVPDPAGFLHEAWRSIRPSGALILTVPFAARWHSIPHDYWRFTPSCLKDLLLSSRFEDIVVYARGNALTMACHKNMALIIQLLMPHGPRSARSLAGQAIGALLLPFFGLYALLGNLSFRAGGDDCIGNTVFARKRAE